MPIGPNHYGPFAPVVGYGGAIMSAAAAMFFLWGGKMEKWRPPDEDLPGAAEAFVLFLCGVGIVVQWYVAVRSIVGWLLVIVAALAMSAVLSFLKYSSLLGTHVYIKRVAKSQQSTEEIRILGGRNLLPDAEARRQERRIDIQSLLEGAAYNVDLLWSREERQWVKRRVLFTFIVTLVCGTSALAGAAFAIQTLLTEQAPVEGDSRQEDTGPSVHNIVSIVQQADEPEARLG